MESTPITVGTISQLTTNPCTTIAKINCSYQRIQELEQKVKDQTEYIQELKNKIKIYEAILDEEGCK